MKWLLILMVALLFFGSGVIANESGLTFVGEDELEILNLNAPGKRIHQVFRQGDRVVIKCSNVSLIPVGEGESMLPMVTEDHLVLIITEFDPSDIQVGDFIVVDNARGRYFHQVTKFSELSGSLVFWTRGINCLEIDPYPVSPGDIVGIAIAVFW